MPSSHEWNNFWFSVAQTVSRLSKDAFNRVGAVVVTPDNKQCSIGYNGFPAGIKENTERWERPEKYEWVIHAEKNAIANCPFRTEGCSIYVTLQPCHICMGFLLNAGITRIYYAKEYDRLARPDIWNELAREFQFVAHQSQL